MTNSKPAPQGSLPFGAGQNTFFNEEPPATQQPNDGGAERDRTDDLLLAKQALSQLSYTPAEQAANLSGLAVSWWAREDLNLRPHAYQARALTS